MRQSVSARLARDREKRLAADAQRRREVLEPVDAVTVRRNGRRLVNFSGNDYLGLADRHDIGLWLDDAHGIGVLGENGRGILEHFGVDACKIDALVVTFGKSLGTQGAAILGDRALIDGLTNRARGIIYSTAMAPPLAAATSRALSLLGDEPWRRARLAENISRFRQRAGSLPLSSSATPIQPIVIGDNARAIDISRRIGEAGFLVRAIRPPTAPEGTARLRITLSCEHRPEQIDQLVEVLLGCMR